MPCWIDELVIILYGTTLVNCAVFDLLCCARLGRFLCYALKQEIYRFPCGCIGGSSADSSGGCSACRSPMLKAARLIPPLNNPAACASAYTTWSHGSIRQQIHQYIYKHASAQTSPGEKHALQPSRSWSCSNNSPASRPRALMSPPGTPVLRLGHHQSF